MAHMYKETKECNFFLCEDCWKPSVHLPSFINVHGFQNRCGIFNVFPQIYGHSPPPYPAASPDISICRKKQQSQLQCEEIQESSDVILWHSTIGYRNSSHFYIIYLLFSFICETQTEMFRVWLRTLNHRLFSLKRAALKGSHTGLEWHEGV